MTKDLSTIDTPTLEQARKEITADLSQDSIHDLEHTKILDLAAQILRELERRQGKRQRTHQQEKKQPGNRTTPRPEKKQGSLLSTILLVLTAGILIVVLLALLNGTL